MWPGTLGISASFDPELMRQFGEIGSKAFSSHYDHQLYEAIRHLSILKADPNSTEKEIKHNNLISDFVGFEKIIEKYL